MSACQSLKTALRHQAGVNCATRPATCESCQEGGECSREASRLPPPGALDVRMPPQGERGPGRGSGGWTAGASGGVIRGRGDQGAGCRCRRVTHLRGGGPESQIRVTVAGGGQGSCSLGPSCTEILPHRDPGSLASRAGLAAAWAWGARLGRRGSAIRGHESSSLHPASHSTKPALTPRVQPHHLSTPTA